MTDAARLEIKDIIARLAENMDDCGIEDIGCPFHCDLTLISAELALMEAVCEAAEHSMKNWSDFDYNRVLRATRALAAYRERRGHE